ncbi:unnamed protein product, partial [Mesorhabditis belari]|uniref:CHK kinase-like domain-containing protein n=1 Tax=Mesorhabditis belari TaxID=2138241 RepID=A0AAF3EK10_9BILA
MLCQGDIWSPNILWKTDEYGEFHVGGLVDWQVTQVGSPLEDLVFLFHSTLSVKEYSTNLNDYIQFYFEQLKAERDSMDLPWESLDELIKSYEITYAYMIPILLPLTVSMVDFEKSCSESKPG